MRISRSNNNKDKEGYGLLDVSQHGVAMHNNRGVDELLCNFHATSFLCSYHLILLQPEPNAEFFGCLISFGVQQTSS